MISTVPRLPLDWTASLMVDPDDFEQVSLLTVIDSIRRDRPSADAPAVTEDDLRSHERLVASRPITLTSRAKGPLINKVSNIRVVVDIMTEHEAGRSAAAEVRLRLADVGRTDTPADGGE